MTFHSDEKNPFRVYDKPKTVFTTDLDDFTLMKSGFSNAKEVQSSRVFVERCIQEDDFVPLLRYFRERLPTQKSRDDNEGWTVQSIAETYALEDWPHDSLDFFFNIFCEFPDHVSIDFVMSVWTTYFQRTGVQDPRKWQAAVDKAFDMYCKSKISERDFKHLQNMATVQSILSR